jgi:capsular exopolysaccharide synthesis family protein
MYVLSPLQDKSLVITSLHAEAGKSTIASNLAISFAQQGLRTVLLDGDLRKGLLHEFFEIPINPGLSDFLTAPIPAAQPSFSAVQSQPYFSDIRFNDQLDLLFKPAPQQQASYDHSFFKQQPSIEDYLAAVINKTHVPNLHLIPCGNYLDNPSDLLRSFQFREMKNILSHYFDIILIDTPPLGAVVDSAVIQDMFAKYIIIVKAGKTNIVDLNNKIHEFFKDKDKILGMILNFATVDKKITYYKYSKYYTSKKP